MRIFNAAPPDGGIKRLRVKYDDIMYGQVHPRAASPKDSPFNTLGSDAEGISIPSFNEEPQSAQC